LEATAKRLSAAALNRWSIKMSVVGNPVVFENDGILLDNFGPVVDGMWIAREVEHRVDMDGYSTHMTLKGKSTGRGGGGIIWPIYVWEKMTGMVTGALSIAQKSYLKKSGKYWKVDVGKKKKGRKGHSSVGATIGKKPGKTISKGTK